MTQGDRLAEGELYRRYAARVYTLCRRYLGDDEEAKDLMQESLIQALDKIQTFNGSKGSLYGWISRIAINKALNQIKRKRWRTVSLDAWTQDTIPICTVSTDTRTGRLAKCWESVRKGRLGCWPKQGSN